MKKEQPILGKTGTLLFLVVISAFPPLSTDLYLPALPTMLTVFKTNQSMVNLTLSVYLVTYALGLLFWGPLSEKFGRKPIMLLGTAIYFMASVLCALAINIEFLIFARVLQAFGGSAITIVATAIVKDLYDGREREKIMATIISLVTLAPLVAPAFGALLLKFTSWRMIFVVLSVFAALSAVLVMCYQETLKEKYSGSVVRSWSRLAFVLNNRNFTSLLFVFSITSMPFMAFIAAGSYIYIDHFGFSGQTFSYLFAFNALFASVGPRIYIKVSERVSLQHIVTASFSLLIVTGVITYWFGHLSPWLFAMLTAVATLAVVTLRVPGMNLMLEQQDSDTGSAVAIIQFVRMMCGAAAMVLVSLQADNLISNLGMIQAVIGVLGCLLWFRLRKHSASTSIK